MRVQGHIEVDGWMTRIAQLVVIQSPHTHINSKQMKPADTSYPSPERHKRLLAIASVDSLEPEKTSKGGGLFRRHYGLRFVRSYGCDSIDTGCDIGTAGF